ncbi:MAG: hypothetical protein LAO08_09970 [Acidobacteriia bacterium]|nr:hypothetical protein [Terriglobia bacterium]
MGTSALAVIAGLGLFALKEIRTYSKHGWEALKSHWAGDAGFGILLTAGLWSCLFVWCLAKVVYQDHEALIARLKIVSQTPVVESNIDAKRIQEVRSGLAELIRRGIAIRDRAIRNQLDPAVISSWRKWRGEADRFLVENLDTADAETFRSYNIDSSPLTETIMAEITDLEQIINRQQVPMEPNKTAPVTALQRPSPKTPPVQINNTPSGIAIGGGTVTNPTVNNFGPLNRRLNQKQTVDLESSARSACSTLGLINVTASNGNQEAQRYALDFVNALKGGGCKADLSLPIPGLTPDVTGVGIGVRDMNNIDPIAQALKRILSDAKVQFYIAPMKPDFFRDEQTVLVIGARE